MGPLPFKRGGSRAGNQGGGGDVWRNRRSASARPSAVVAALVVHGTRPGRYLGFLRDPRLLGAARTRGGLARPVHGHCLLAAAQRPRLARVPGRELCRGWEGKAAQPIPPATRPFTTRKARPEPPLSAAM